jgi:hypothetical protein
MGAHILCENPRCLRTKVLNFLDPFSRAIKNICDEKSSRPSAKNQEQNIVVWALGKSAERLNLAPAKRRAGTSTKKGIAPQGKSLRDWPWAHRLAD